MAPGLLLPRASPVASLTLVFQGANFRVRVCRSGKFSGSSDNCGNKGVERGPSVGTSADLILTGTGGGTLPRGNVASVSSGQAWVRGALAHCEEAMLPPAPDLGLWLF